MQNLQITRQKEHNFGLFPKRWSTPESLLQMDLEGVDNGLLIIDLEIETNFTQLYSNSKLINYLFSLKKFSPLQGFEPGTTLIPSQYALPTKLS